MAVLAPYIIEILPYKIRSHGFAVMVSESFLIAGLFPQTRHLSVSLPELDVVPRARIQPVCKPLGSGCNGVEIRKFGLPQFRGPGHANHPRVGQYLVYCCWLVFELTFVLTMIVETKGSHERISF